MFCLIFLAPRGKESEPDGRGGSIALEGQIGLNGAAGQEHQWVAAPVKAYAGGRFDVKEICLFLISSLQKNNSSSFIPP